MPWISVSSHMDTRINMYSYFKFSSAKSMVSVYSHVKKYFFTMLKTFFNIYVHNILSSFQTVWKDKGDITEQQYDKLIL